MPTYEYRCKDCGHTFDAYQAFTDDALSECPKCAGALRKLFGNVGISFKGSGFYKTDSRAKASGGESSSSGESDGASESSSSKESSSPDSSSKDSASKESSSGSKDSEKSKDSGRSKDSGNGGSSGSKGEARGTSKPTPASSSGRSSS